MWTSGERLKRQAAAAVLLLALIPFSSADTLTGRVVKVYDGDTITLLIDNKQYKIRLAGIDAPERKQAFGNASRRHLASMVAGQVVRVEWDKMDRYGRYVGKVWVDSKDANVEQIHAGMAWHFKRYESEQPPEDRVTYARAEKGARAKRIGLWQEEALAPWEWRKINRR